MKSMLQKLLFLGFIFVGMPSYAMQEWIRTNLENLGITEPKPSSPTEELKRIIDREGTFKNVGLKKIQELIGLQADAKAVSRSGNTALLIAIGDYEPSDKPTDAFLLVRLLAEFSKADINKRYGQGLTPLAIAAGDGKAALIPVLIRFGADIHTRDDQRNTPLILVARLADQQKSVDVATKLQDAGIDVNAQNINGETALYRAVLRKNYQLIKFLVDHGADASLANNQGQTPLALAQANNDQKAIDLLRPQAQRI